MTDKFKALRDAANRCARVNADVALLCEAALAAVAEGEHLESRLQQVGQAARENRSRRVLELEAEVEALRKDAARYRWLREHADVTLEEPVWIVTDQGQRIHGNVFARHETDLAIDAALRAKEERRG